MNRGILSLIITAGLMGSMSMAAEWPTFGHDHQRSASTEETLEFPLSVRWEANAGEPRRAWPDPARQDFWQRIDSVKPRVTHDRAFGVAIAGNHVVFGTSGDDTIHCLNAETGEPIWETTLNGPVRFAPTLWSERVFVGSDDGGVYCLDLWDGRVLWRRTATEDERMLPGNERIISAWPIRTNVALADGVAYVAAGLFPNEGAWLFALDARNGDILWQQPVDTAPQGYILLSETRVYLPAGRAQPMVFLRATGELIERLGGGGGTYALLTDDEFIYGPGRYGSLDAFDANSGESMASFPGNHMIVDGRFTYLHTDTHLSRIDRVRLNELRAEEAEITHERNQLTQHLRESGDDVDAEELEAAQQHLRELQLHLAGIQEAIPDCVTWMVECNQPHALIRSGDHLIAGGAGHVVAYHTETGEAVWRGTVEGIAYGLAVAEGRLFVSTDQGTVYGFSPDADAPSRIALLPQGEKPPSPPEADVFAQWYDVQADLRHGYALLSGDSASHYADVLLHAGELHLVLVTDSPEQVDAWRTRYRGQGVYGSRVHVLQGDAADLPFVESMFSLIAVDAKPSISTGTLKSFLRPHGGQLFVPATLDGSESVDWARPLIHGYDGEFVVGASFVTWKRGALAGEGQWTHLYASPANTASSGDTRIHDDVRVQWFGQPGPNRMIDRHLRSMSPLVLNGRGYIAGNDTVISFDVYNGARLWQREVPGLARVGLPYDAGNMAVDDRSVYLAVDEHLLTLDAGNGQETGRITMQNGLHWGYVAVERGRLYGSGQRAGAARETQNRDEILEQYGEYRPLVLSERLVSHDAVTGERFWKYENGRIINTTLTLADGKIWFVESRSPRAMANASGRLSLSDLLTADTFLVSLNAMTGERLWEKPFSFDGCRHILYLSYSEGVLLAVGADNNVEDNRVWYTLYGMNATNGDVLWTQSHGNNRGGLGGDHGEQVHHPAITNRIVIAEPEAYDLQTGTPVHPAGLDDDWTMSSARGGCGTISTSAHCLFYRDGNPIIHPLNSDRDPSPLSLVNRTGCWINVIPAAGLVLMPEASSGCTCAHAIQTSIAYSPRSN